jgi:acyl carrier protein
MSPQLVAAIREHLPLVPPDVPITPDFDLVAGGLDSLAMVSLLLHLEEEFRVKIPDDKLNWATFRTPGTLWETIVALSPR